MKIKTADLIGPALDWAAAQCEMMREGYRDQGLLIHRIGYGQPIPPYSTDWAWGGPIIERENISVGYERYSAPDGETWDAVMRRKNIYLVYGPTPLVAAMRCFVTSKLGDEAELPEGFI